MVIGIAGTFGSFLHIDIRNKQGVVRYVRDSDVKAVEYEVKLPKNKR